MRKVLLGSTASAALLLAVPVMAADMAVKAPPPVYYNWTGFYVGVNAGGTWDASNDFNVTTVPVTAFAGNAAGILIAHGIPAAQSATANLGSGNGGRFIGGGQIGYNWQFNSAVAGIEADIQGVTSRDRSFSATNVALVCCGSAAAGTPDVTTFAASKALDYLGTVRGRLGVLPDPRLLAYVTGGLAYGGVSGSAGFTTVNVFYPAIGLSPIWGTAGSFSSTRAGWTVGAGLEWLLGPNWSVKAEYLYYDLGSVIFALGTSGSIVIPPGVPVGAQWFTNASTATTRYNGNIVRFGLNYRFGYAPVVAKY
jgi:outer membrane immunogenic protein